MGGGDQGHNLGRDQPLDEGGGEVAGLAKTPVLLILPVPYTAAMSQSPTPPQGGPGSAPAHRQAAWADAPTLTSG